MTQDIPLLIKRCLAHRIRIYPYQLQGILHQYQSKTIPNDILEGMSPESLDKYVEGLYLSSCESAGDWSRGHEILKELGFNKTERKDGHRSFVGLVWGESDEQ